MSYFKPSHPQSPSSAPEASDQSPESSQASAEAPIRVDGFAQVLAMLRVADPEFRDSLLERLAARDRKLARSLRADLGL